MRTAASLSGGLLVVLAVLCLSTQAKSVEKLCWTEVEGQGVLGYRGYFSTYPVCWDEDYVIEFSTYESCELYSDTPGVCCDGGLTPMGQDQPLPGNLIFFIITAYNAAGESITEHGPIQEICP